MIGGYALSWVGMLMGLIGFLVFIAGFSAGTGYIILGIILMVGGGFCKYVSRQTTRTAK